MTDADLILRLVEMAPRSLRAGSESLVVLYLWVRKRRSQAGFAAAVSEAVGKNYLQVRRDGGFFLRLTPIGFGYLQHSPGSDLPITFDDAETTANGPAQARLLAILATLNRHVPRAVSPAALKQIWAIRSYRASDLRKAIDSLIDAGYLAMTVTELPGFVLTQQGRKSAGLTMLEGSD